VQPPLQAVHRLLLLHLHRVAQTQRPEEQLLALLGRETERERERVTDQVVRSHVFIFVSTNPVGAGGGGDL